ncbi:MAG: tetratricopeptide repeat protein [Flavobacteriales bacterium]|nr:tetratricopeptide repeat protein [Flavobacteriales bacterium]MCC6939394.1 tetratricopeptide repeat protein [Flavobacteriales bacterium]
MRHPIAHVLLVSLLGLIRPFGALAQGDSGVVDCDSLQRAWNNSTLADSSRSRAGAALIWECYLFSRTDSALSLAELFMKQTRAQHDTVWIIKAYTMLGVGNAVRGDQATAIDMFAHGLELQRARHDEEGMAGTMANIGNLNKIQGELDSAITYYQSAYDILFRIGDTLGAAKAVYSIAVARSRLQDTTRVEADLLRSLELYEKVGSREGMALALDMLGSIRDERDDTPGALAYYQRALEMHQSVGNRHGEALTLGNMAIMYKNDGDWGIATDLAERALRMAQEADAAQPLAIAARTLWILYKRQGQQAPALEMYELYIATRDSLSNAENRSEMIRFQFKSEFEQRKALLAAEQEKKDVLAAEQLKRARVVRNGFVGGFVFVLVFAAVFFFQRNRISKEKKRSEELLLNILPEEVAEELKDTGAARAKHFDNATILFTDFKGFTEASEKLTPQELVEELNTCFKAFDNIITARGIEKIKTIGDAYMCAGGLPDPKTSSPADVVHAALEMQAFMITRKQERDAMSLPAFEMRVGIHTGPVVAGIVGVKKFQYDIWGDTVNTASRMESSGEVGQVNISEATYALVKDVRINEAGAASTLRVDRNKDAVVASRTTNNGQPPTNNEQPPTTNAFTFTPRGKVQAKGKGEMEMYFVKV